MKKRILFAAAALAAAPAGVMAALGGDARVGPEVRQMCFSSSVDRWSAVEGEDGVILLDRAANDWYRFAVSKGCSEKRIRRANLVVIEGKPGSACLTRNDSITLVDFGGMKYNCRIKQINEWTVDGAAPDVGAAPATGAETDADD